jgi:hypothetical protein
MALKVKFHSKSLFLLFIFSIPFNLQIESTLCDLTNDLCNQRINWVFHKNQSHNSVILLLSLFLTLRPLRMTDLP